MSITNYFDDYTFDEFDTLDFDAFDALDGFESYPSSFYDPDKRASAISGGLSFLTVLPRADSDVSAADRLQVGDRYRGIAAAIPSYVLLRDEGHLVGGVLPLAGGLA